MWAKRVQISPRLYYEGYVFVPYYVNIEAKAHEKTKMTIVLSCHYRLLHFLLHYFVY